MAFADKKNSRNQPICRTPFDDSEDACILPMVGQTHHVTTRDDILPASLQQLTDIISSSVERLRNRLERISHELKRADNETLGGALDGQRIRKLAAVVDDISTDLLHLSDLIAPDAPVNRWVSPRGVLESLLFETLRKNPDLRHTMPRIVLDVAEGHSIYADPTIVNRVLATLLDNAIEATATNGEVVITSVEYADAIEIEVADSGTGLSNNTKSRLFEPGFSTKPDGTGLALASARVLVEQLGGALDAINCPDGGTAFTLRVPHGKAMRQAA